MRAIGLIKALFDAAIEPLYHRPMFWRAFHLSFVLLLCLFLGSGSLPPADLDERVRAFTRPLEFDYISWTIDAALIKLEQAILGNQAYLPPEQNTRQVLDYLALIREIEQTEGELSQLHAHPDPSAVAEQLKAKRAHLDQLFAQRQELAPLVEAILQAQLSQVAADFGLASAGQPVPPVLYHSTPLPWALIVSPREAIQQEANISLKTELTLDEHNVLEDEVSESLDVSTLVVPVGGVGSYPTMVAQSSDLNWLAEVIAHEWIHNYLTLRPLGLLYNRNHELRTMNETAANLAGKELGAALIKRFYPALAPPPQESEAGSVDATTTPEAPAFDFRAEMHATRIQVDALLAAGKIDEAEAYMEERRLFFWEHGYPIRKLNQAYFAFYGSYADVPAGPAGEDPVGAAVRALRLRSPTLAQFIKQIAFLSSFEQLQELLEKGN